MRSCSGRRYLLVLLVGMFVGRRTGEMFDASVAGFAVVTTAGLLQDHSPPEIAGQLEQFFR